MNNFFDNERILQVIWRRKFHFLVIGIAAIILAVIFSGPAFIQPKFRSTARIYPINLPTLSEESETEQMLEILNSRDIKLKMFKAFNLDEVYNISPDDPHYLTYMIDIYNENVSPSKTKFETVEIDVLDYNPQRASDMCDSIIHFYNTKVRDMHKAKDLEMVQISKNGLSRKFAELDTVTNLLDSVRRNYGILDYESQVERVTQGYMEALANGRASNSGTREIENLYENLAEQGSKAQWLEGKYEFLQTAIDSLTIQYEYYLSEYEKDITYSHVVEYPVPADKKSYPVRWLIVGFSTVSAVFIALLVFLILDYRKKE